MNDIKTQVRSYIVDNFIMNPDAASFADGDSFLDKHLVDSTGFLELVTFVEETWNLVVEDEEMVPENLDSLDHIDAYVRRKRSANTLAA